MATSYLFAIIIVFNLRLTGASVNITKVHDSAEALDNEGTVLAEHSTLTYKYSKLDHVPCRGSCIYMFCQLSNFQPPTVV